MSAIFSKILKSLRLENAITQKELASELGVSQNTVYQWENGFEPSMDKLQAIAEFFCVSIDQLYGGRKIHAKSEQEQEILHTIEKLNIINKAKLIGYGKCLLESQSDEVESKNNTQTARKV